MHAREEAPRIRWATPVAVVYVVLVTLLTMVILLMAGRSPGVDGAAWLGLAGVIAPWVLELAGVPWPRVVLSLVSAATVAYVARASDDLVAPLFLLLLVMWVSYRGSRRESVAALALSLLSLAPFWSNLEVSVPWTVGILAFWFAAQAMMAQQRTLVQLRAAQVNLAAQAAAAERQRIAGEIHDLVAHSLAVTMLHLTGARHILQRDPQRAEQALAQAERLGRQSLADIRHTVGLLQGPDASNSTSSSRLAPIPTALDVRTLVDEYASAGMQVELTVNGDLDELATVVSLAVYRIAQEALANVAKHATRARAQVELLIDDAKGVVSLRVRDGGGVAEVGSPNGGDSGSGIGLPGMRKRADLLGGSLSAGPDTAGRGWLVDCTLPISPPRTSGLELRSMNASGD